MAIDLTSYMLGKKSSGGGADLNDYFISTVNNDNDVSGFALKSIKKIPDITLSNNVTNINRMFYNISTMPNITTAPKIISSSSLTSLQDGYYGGLNFEEIDLSGLNSTNITNCTSTFNGCKSLKSIDLTPLNNAPITSIWQMFYGCQNLKSIDMSSLNLANLSGNSARQLCQNCYLLETFIFPLNMPNVDRAVRETFLNCYSLKTIVILNPNVVYTYNSVMQNNYHFTGTYDATYNPDSLQDGYIYVPDLLVNDYKTATGWSDFATQIKGLSELPSNNQSNNNGGISDSGETTDGGEVGGEENNEGGNEPDPNNNEEQNE